MGEHGCLQRDSVMCEDENTSCVKMKTHHLFSESYSGAPPTLCANLHSDHSTEESVEAGQKSLSGREREES